MEYPKQPKILVKQADLPKEMTKEDLIIVPLLLSTIEIDKDRVIYSDLQMWWIGAALKVIVLILVAKDLQLYNALYVLYSWSAIS